MEKLVMFLIIAAVWLIPVTAGVWVLVTLHRIRTDQDALRLKIETIECLLQRTAS